MLYIAQSSIFVAMTKKKAKRPVFQISLGKKWADLREYLKEQAKEKRTSEAGVARDLMLEGYQQRLKEG